MKILSKIIATPAGLLMSVAIFGQSHSKDWDKVGGGVDNSGEANKLTDHARAAVAILGKAVTGLGAGQGIVLVALP